MRDSWRTVALRSFCARKSTELSFNESDVLIILPAAHAPSAHVPNGFFFAQKAEAAAPVSVLEEGLVPRSHVVNVKSVAHVKRPARMMYNFVAENGAEMSITAGTEVSVLVDLMQSPKCCICFSPEPQEQQETHVFERPGSARNCSQRTPSGWVYVARGNDVGLVPAEYVVMNTSVTGGQAAARARREALMQRHYAAACRRADLELMRQTQLASVQSHTRRSRPSTAQPVVRFFN